MASNYNRRSGSSGSRRPSDSRPRQASPTARSDRGARTPNARDARPRQRTQYARPSGDTQIRSTRIGDINRDARRQPRTSKKRVNGRLVAVVVIVVLLVVGVVGGYVAARLSGAFPIEETQVIGVEHLTDTEVAELAQIPSDATLLNVDTAAIRDRLLLDTWVKDAQVNVVFPNCLQIVVTERQIEAVVEVSQADSSTTKQWALSSDGMWLMPIPDRNSEAGKNTSAKVFEDADAAMHIINMPYGTNPQIGTYCTDSNVNNALEIVSGMTTELANRVKTVSATDSASTTLILDNGVEIAFGSATDIRAKERVCLEILEENEGSVAYINVRTVDRPTWRAA